MADFSVAVSGEPYAGIWTVHVCFGPVDRRTLNHNYEANIFRQNLTVLNTEQIFHEVQVDVIVDLPERIFEPEEFCEWVKKALEG
jgi:hypothetical protein